MNKVTSTENVILDFVYDASSWLVGVNTIEGNYFYVRDITGNIIGLIDKNGNFVVKYKYDAWGKLLKGLPSEDDEDLCIAARFNPFLYKDCYYDVETQFLYQNKRYYNPKIARFIQPKSLSYNNLKLFNGLNMYSYVFNNPIVFSYNKLPESDNDVIQYSNLFINMGNIVSKEQIQKKNSVSYEPKKITNPFNYYDNSFSLLSGLIKVNRTYNGLADIKSLENLGIITSIYGLVLNILFSACENYLNPELSIDEKNVSFGVDVIHNIGQTVGTWGLSCIPYAGPFLAILVPVKVEFLWSGEINFFGYEIEREPLLLIDGKTPEVLLKEWISSWFD